MARQKDTLGGREERGSAVGETAVRAVSRAPKRESRPGAGESEREGLHRGKWKGRHYCRLAVLVPALSAPLPPGKVSGRRRGRQQQQTPVCGNPTDCSAALNYDAADAS